MIRSALEPTPVKWWFFSPHFFIASLICFSALFRKNRALGSLMNTTKLLIAATTAAGLALLAACGGTASKDAAGTLMEANHSTAEAKHATTEEAHTAEDHAAAVDAGSVAAESDAASAAKATGKNGKLSNARTPVLL